MGTLLYRSVLLTQINTNIAARSDLYCLFYILPVLKLNLCSVSRKFSFPRCSCVHCVTHSTHPRFVVVRTSNMAASIHWPASCSRVSKNRSGYPVSGENCHFRLRSTTSGTHFDRHNTHSCVISVYGRQLPVHISIPTILIHCVI